MGSIGCRAHIASDPLESSREAVQVVAARAHTCYLGVRRPSPHVGEHDLVRHAIARSSPIPPSNTLPTAHPVGPLLAQDVSRPSSDGRFPVVRRSMDSCRVTGGPTRPSRPLFPPYFLAFATFVLSLLRSAAGAPVGQAAGRTQTSRGNRPRRAIAAMA